MAANENMVRCLRLCWHGRSVRDPNYEKSWRRRRSLGNCERLRTAGNGANETEMTPTIESLGDCRFRSSQDRESASFLILQRRPPLLSLAVAWASALKRKA